jgi:heme exporter protein B
MRTLLYLCLKDVRLEARKKESCVVGVSLGLLLSAIAYFGVQSAFLKPEFEQALFPGLIWILFVFSGTVALSRSFDHELEHNALEAVLLAGVSSEQIYVAKVCSSLLVLSIIFIAVFASLFLLLNLSVDILGPALGICSLLVLLGYCSLSVLLVVLTTQSNAGVLLFPVVFLPLLFPLFFAGVELYAALIIDRAFSWQNPWVSFLLLLDTVYFLLGLNLFRFAVRR